MKVYFTFGQSHKTKEGYPMKDYWVKVIGDNQDECKELFIEQFRNVYMDDKNKYGNTYTDEEFNSKYFDREFFPKGEFMLILKVK